MITFGRIRESRLLRLPSGVTVGDEFRVHGRVRVTSLAEQMIEVTALGDMDAVFQPAERNAKLVFVSVEIEQDA